MILKHTFISLLLSSAAAAAPAPSLDRRNESQGFKWGPCPEDDPNAAVYAESPFDLECGTLQVPLDWTSPDSNATHTISLLRVLAPKQPAKGSIQINFGGPGYGAKRGLAGSAGDYVGLSGGEYNIIGYDPRGTSPELPFACATNNFTISQVLSTAVDMSTSERDFMRGWAWGTQAVGLCEYQGIGNETAEYIGTAAMARDMARIAEVIDEDGLIRYWGISYGATLGATIAAMFPDRIDRLIIDGIQNAKQYYYEYTDSELWTLNDKVVDYFFDACIEAGPELCALAAFNRTGAELSRDFYNLAEELYKAPVGVATSGTIIDGLVLKSTMFQTTYSVATWSDFALIVAALLYGSEEEKKLALTGGVPPAVSGSLGISEANWGIHCGDRIPRTDSYEDLVQPLRKQFSESYYVGGPNGATQAVCAQWPWKAKEVYEGNFEAKTKHPIFVLSNSLDGQTPLISARNMSAGFEGAVILENDAVGHGTISYPNSCTAKHVMAYWSDGTLPEEGTVCEAEMGAFEIKDRTWADLVTEMANGTVTTTDGVFSARRWLEKQY